MKARYGLVILLVAVLALVGTGCYSSAKATGGGWFTDDYSGNRITFGFNAYGTVDDNTVTGQVQLIDHGTKPPTKIHGTFYGRSGTNWFEGTCFVNGEGPHPFRLGGKDIGEQGPDKGDWVYVWVGEKAPWEYKYSGYLEGGNIKGHLKQ